MTEQQSDIPPEPAPRSLAVRLGLGSAIFQGVLVVVGVVLGFLVTEWQNDASERAEAGKALASIVEEINANRDSVVSSRDYHAARIAILDEATKTKTPPELRAFDRGFVSPAQVSAAAWASASETGALAHLPFDHVLALSRVYSQQAAYQQQQATVSSVIYGELFERGPPGILEHHAGLRAIIATFSYREQQLADAYDQALKSLDE